MTDDTTDTGERDRADLRAAYPDASEQAIENAAKLDALQAAIGRVADRLEERQRNRALQAAVAGQIEEIEQRLDTIARQAGYSTGSAGPVAESNGRHHSALDALAEKLNE